MEILKVQKLTKIYNDKVSHKALSSIDLSIKKGEFVGIMGPSGSGKTTLLNVISTIDSPTSGEVFIHGKQPHTLSQEALAVFRRQQLGFVFQSYNLLPTLTVFENIVLPLTLDGAPVKEMKKRTVILSKKLGIYAILNKRTYEISGGQAQRTAIARALIHNPKLLLADEPTGNLDSKAAKDVMELLTKMNKEESTMMLVTHDAMAASYCSRVVFIKDGELYNEIYAGDHRKLFYQKIMNILSLMGGDASDFSTVRI